MPPGRCERGAAAGHRYRTQRAGPGVLDGSHNADELARLKRLTKSLERCIGGCNVLAALALVDK
ncbi:hypothetical protein XHV734_4689 [Xanthomonas hortorum pv. vitians]|nr:hypothetical protein XHV734_4689 [Xanthomonas hortorum pv. vitians]